MVCLSRITFWIFFSSFLKAVFHKYNLVHSWIPYPIWTCHLIICLPLFWKYFSIIPSDCQKSLSLYDPIQLLKVIEDSSKISCVIGDSSRVSYALFKKQLSDRIRHFFIYQVIKHILQTNSNRKKRVIIRQK